MNAVLRSLLLPVSLTVLLANAAGRDPAALPRSSPEAQGVSSAAILGFLEEAEQKVASLHSVMLVRHGKVVAEGWWSPYDSQTPHELYSLSKSFTSTAVGFAVAEGKLSLDTTVMSVFPEDLPSEINNHLKAMRVRDLLTMSTGHDKEPPTSPDQVSAKSFLAQPVASKPGTRFLYNTAATFMLSAMVQKTTGQTVLDYLGSRLFDPLGIRHPTWQTNFQGVSLGGYGLSIRTEDIARFGQLYLQGGRWKGKSLIPASWVEMATRLQTSNGSNPNSDWDQGYGFQFWRCRHGAYRGDGAFGQYCIVMPEQDAVIAITSGLGDMQAVMNLVWDRLLPAMQKRSLLPNPSAEKRLQERLGSLTLPLPHGKATSALVRQIDGRSYVFPANEQRLEELTMQSGPGAETVMLSMRVDGKDRRLRVQHGRWEKGQFPYGAQGDRPVGVGGAWESDEVYVLKLCYYETPFTLTMRLRFAGDQVVCDAETNVAFGPTKRPQLVGKRR